MLATIKRIYAPPTATRPHAALTWVLGYLFALGLAVLAAPRAAPQDPAPWVLGLAYTLTAFVAQGWLALLGAHGLANGLQVILEAAEKLRNYPVRFRLVGDGPDKP